MRFRTRPSCQRTMLIVEASPEDDDGRPLLFQTMHEAPSAVIAEEDFDPNDVSTLFISKKQRKKNQGKRIQSAPDDSLDEEIATQEAEMRLIKENYEGAEDWSLYIENEDGVRIDDKGRIYDEELRKRERAELYESSMEQCEAKLSELRRRKDEQSIPKKKSPDLRKPQPKTVRPQPLQKRNVKEKSPSPEVVKTAVSKRSSRLTVTFRDQIIHEEDDEKENSDSTLPESTLSTGRVMETASTEPSSTLIDRTTLPARDEDLDEQYSFVQPTRASIPNKKNAGGPRVPDRRVKSAPIAGLILGDKAAIGDEIQQEEKLATVVSQVSESPTVLIAPDKSTTFDFEKFDTAPSAQSRPEEAFVSYRFDVLESAKDKNKSQRFSQLLLSPIKSDSPPRGQQTAPFATSTPCPTANTKKDFVTSTPLTAVTTSAAADTPNSLFATRVEREHTEPQQATCIDEPLTDFREETRPPTALSSTTMRQGDVSAYSTAVDRTGLSLISAVTKARNATQMISFYGANKSQVKKLPFYLDDFTGDPNDFHERLLHVTKQVQPISWKDFGINKARKLGEGSYAEVFEGAYGAHTSAIKLIPFNSDDNHYDGTINGERLSEPEDLVGEVVMTKELASLNAPGALNSTPNFIHLLGAHVVKGKYPAPFLKAWDKFDKEKKSENDRPSKYHSKQQLFLAICLSMGGIDLEKYELENEAQIISILLQVAWSLVIAEEVFQFEHRDLHVGNVLVDQHTGDVEYRFRGKSVRVKSHGVKVNIIDFTLSRMTKEGHGFYKDLAKDEELFTNYSGNYQFEIYRKMREATKDDWVPFLRKTNLFWLHYLAYWMIKKKTATKKLTAKRKKELMSIFDKLLKADGIDSLFTDPEYKPIIGPFINLV